MTRTFQNLLWGATVGAHEVEGADFDSDWWRWEQRASHIADGATSETGADHHTRFAGDYALAKKLGHTTLLVTLSWARIQPVAATFNEAGLAHYVERFKSMRKNGLEPVCALWHTALPAWFAKAGGWERPGAAGDFQAYAEGVAKALGTHCQWWIPLFEPSHWLDMAYRDRLWPGKHGIGGRARAWRHLTQAQVAAAACLRDVARGGRVGVSVCGGVFQPDNRYSAWDVRAAQREQRHHAQAFYRAVVKESSEQAADFVALSYFGEARVRFSARHPWGRFACRVGENGERVNSGVWEPNPRGLRTLIEACSPADLPLMVIAHADSTDRVARCGQLLDHLWVLKECVERGRDIHAYLHRSLLDGFEWDRGCSLRRGLVHVDHDTFARTPNDSAYLLKEIVAAGEIRPGSLAQFCPDWTPPAQEEDL